jgi:hypothetical protein
VALGDPQKPNELLEQTLGIQEKDFGPNHIEVAKTLTNLCINHEVRQSL